MKNTALILTCTGIVLVTLTVSAPKTGAHPVYSEDQDATRCRECHGNFRSNNYVSLTDGQNWGNLHNIHRNTMLDMDCAACHMDPDGGDVPVFTSISAGGAGFQAISCVGCHGRNEDMGHDSISPGRGAGLRQHHTNAGVDQCVQCHFDANPANYTPVGEGVPPPYYFMPDPNHPDKPTDPCNSNGEENYAGIAEGLNNDGDGVYDTLDSDCMACEGDTNGDGLVNVTDLTNIILDWGCTDPPGPCIGDVTGDGATDVQDLTAVIVAWGICA